MSAGPDFAESARSGTRFIDFADFQDCRRSVIVRLGWVAMMLQSTDPKQSLTVTDGKVDASNSCREGAQSDAQLFQDFAGPVISGCQCEVQNSRTATVAVNMLRLVPSWTLQTVC